MTLSNEQFQEIISNLVSDQSKKLGEKRREPRVGVRFEAMVTPLTLDDNGVHKMPVIVRDISPSGINVLSHKNMQPATEFILDLPMSDQSSMLLARYEVRHCKTFSDTMYSIGAKLVNVTDAPPAPDALGSNSARSNAGKPNK